MSPQAEAPTQPNFGISSFKALQNTLSGNITGKGGERRYFQRTSDIPGLQARTDGVR
jgi:hypothetical protein